MQNTIVGIPNRVRGIFHVAPVRASIGMTTACRNSCCGLNMIDVGGQRMRLLSSNTQFACCVLERDWLPCVCSFSFLVWLFSTLPSRSNIFNTLTFSAETFILCLIAIRNIFMVGLEKYHLRIWWWERGRSHNTYSNQLLSSNLRATPPAKSCSEFWQDFADN